MFLGRKNKELNDTVLALERINAAQTARISELEKKVETGTACIEAVLKRDISWYDISKLGDTALENYKRDAQHILGTEVFQNEVRHYVADIVQDIARASRSYEDVRDLRMTIIGLEAFIERLQSIPDFARHVTNEEDLYEPI